MEQILNETRPENSSEELSKKEMEAKALFDEVAALEEEIAHGGYVNEDLIRVVQEIISLKTEQAETLLRIDEIESHNQDSSALQNYIHDLKNRIQYEEEKLPKKSESVESSEVFWGESAPKLMTFKEAVVWAQGLSTEPGVEYRIPTIEELEHAHVEQIPGFNTENPYLSITESTMEENEDDRNHWVFDFAKGKRESKGKGFAFAVRVTK